MYLAKTKSRFLICLIILTLTLTACGSIKDDVQGKWQDPKDKDIILSIKDDKAEMIYKYVEDGVNKKI